AAGLLFTLVALMLIPATSQAIFRSLGIETGNDSPVYNGFEPFIPYVPGYFPEDFDITHVSNGAYLSTEVNTYTETYASDEYFFLLIESQGNTVPELAPDPDFLIQNHAAKLTETLELSLSSDDSLDLNRFNTGEIWTVAVELKEIYIQVVTNLPRQEAIRGAEELVPAICTTKPTPEG
ncbi:MAG: hypothetical protein PVI99_09845, partial [Anaerolineales bacterium]